MTNLDALIRRVYQTVLDEHHGNTDRALLDLAARFVRQADGVAAGFVRYPPHRDVRPAKAAPPAIVDPGEDDGA